MKKYGTYQVTFIGDYFTLVATPCSADDYESAIREANETIKYRYGFDVLAVSTVEINVTEVDDTDVRSFDRDEIACINCGDVRIGVGIEGGVCEDCFANLVPNEWHSKW